MESNGLEHSRWVVEIDIICRKSFDDVADHVSSMWIIRPIHVVQPWFICEIICVVVVEFQPVHPTSHPHITLSGSHFLAAS